MIYRALGSTGEKVSVLDVFLQILDKKARRFYSIEQSARVVRAATLLD